MEAGDVLAALGLGIAPPWRLIGRRLEAGTRPNELQMEVAADRGARFACPERDRLCAAHDSARFTWRHLNSFQHHCYMTAFIRRAHNCLAGEAVLTPVAKALETFEKNLPRWTSTHNIARIEGLNGLFQAARARARGYRNTHIFTTMIYLVGAPLGDTFKST
ncbi:MAG: transposase [Kiloniellales bacterium]|nr:transposase [Kiloniellales bacterium]